MSAPIGIDGLLVAARDRLQRLTPEAAADAFFDGALLVDCVPHPGAPVQPVAVIERLDCGGFGQGLPGDLVNPASPA